MTQAEILARGESIRRAIMAVARAARAQGCKMPPCDCVARHLSAILRDDVTYSMVRNHRSTLCQLGHLVLDNQRRILQVAE